MSFIGSVRAEASCKHHPYTQWPLWAIFPYLGSIWKQTTLVIGTFWFLKLVSVLQRPINNDSILAIYISSVKRTRSRRTYKAPIQFNQVDNREWESEAVAAAPDRLCRQKGEPWEVGKG